MNRTCRAFAWMLLLFSVLAGPAGCSLWGGKDTPATGRPSSGKALEVPPGLDLPQVDQRLSVPAHAGYTDGAAGARLLPATPRGRLVQEAGLRYLEINLPPEKVWSRAQAFFRALGFKIEKQDPAVGVFETDWRKSRDFEPESWFGKLFGTVSAAGKMDKYRVRLERVEGAPEKTRVYVTQRGVESVIVNEDDTSELDEIRWQSRPSDPELEAEIMQRFLVFLGLSEAEAKQAMAGGPPAERATIQESGGVPVLAVKENFARTWRRVGLALDRLGLVVDDRDRSKGLYFIRLGEDFIQHRVEKKGFFDRLFPGEENVADKRYLIRVAAQGEGSVVTPLAADGQPEKGEIGKLLIKLLHEQLR